MITPDQIPDEVVEAAKVGYFFAAEINRNAGDVITDVWLAALTAALNAWEGVKWHTVQVPDDSDEVRYMLKKVGIILPLPKDAADE
jgi:hypothetical protein